MDLQNIRDFHNNIKNDIINDVYTHIPYTLNNDESSIMDLACGRGGDIHKIYHTNFKQAFFIDNHSDSLEIARKRFFDSYKNKKFRAQFILHDLKESLLCIPKQVDVVLMNFALNYFFDSEKSLRLLLETVSHSLKDNGYFVGIALDSERVKTSPLKTTLYTLNPFPSFYEIGPYNREYTLSFNDPTDDYFAFRGNMVEYLIDFQELKRIAELYSLELVSLSYINSEEPLLRMDYIFKFIHKKKGSPQQKSNDIYFPKQFHHLNLQIRPETPMVSSRNDASSILTTIVSSLCEDVLLIVDATAHVGCDTLALASTFTNSKVISIEKDIENFEVLKQNLSLCDLNNVTVVNDDFVNFIHTESLHIDVLYIDAPWGGSGYKKKTVLSLFINDIELSDILKEYCKNIKLIILKVPINFDFETFEAVMNDKKMQVFPYNYKNNTKFYFVSVF